MRLNGTSGSNLPQQLKLKTLNSSSLLQGCAEEEKIWDTAEEDE